jgi:Zn2+/Cd2+-exporting ATPase
MSEVKKLLLSRRNAEDRSTFIEKQLPQLELLAALLSGVFILIGWICSKNGAELSSVIFFVLSFIIGGFAKAKEGIEETVKNKELNVEMLMVIAAIGSAIIGYWVEGAILIFIFAVSGALETYTMNKSQKDISSLMDIQPENALRLTDGIEELVHISQLNIGDMILVKPGERIPADGLIKKGNTTIDESAITGESIPVTKGLDNEVFAGTVNLNVAITIKVSKPSTDTLFQKIIELVQTAQSEKSPSQLFIERFEGTYVKIVLLVVLLMMFIPNLLLHWSWGITFYRAMILLVVASPCALVASIMPATLSAISNGARHGIIFKGGIHLEKLSSIKAIAFDKTGTLTKGKPEVTDMIMKDDYERSQLLQIVASIENQSNHPLALAILQYAQIQTDLSLLQPDKVEDIPGWGIKALVNGSEWLIGKKDFVGRDEALLFQNSFSSELENTGKSIVYVKGPHGIVALFGIQDVIRDETEMAIHELASQGIYTIMLTGDSEATAKAIARKANVNEYLAECLPAGKVTAIKEVIGRFGSVGMVGDGINDAPALATADVGIAMGEGTDVALETADIILMKNELTRISEAIRLSKKMNKIVKQNIVFSITVIMLLIASNFLQILNLPYGVIGHEGSTILVILNSLRCLK